MNSHQNQHSNFWFGFLVGAGTSAGALYLFGTKQGRQKLQDTLKLTENMEGTVNDVLDALTATESQPYQSTQVAQSSEQSGQSVLRKIVRIVDLFVNRETKTTSHHYLNEKNI